MLVTPASRQGASLRLRRAGAWGARACANLGAMTSVAPLRCSLGGSSRRRSVASAASAVSATTRRGLLRPDWRDAAHSAQCARTAASASWSVGIVSRSSRMSCSKNQRSASESSRRACSRSSLSHEMTSFLRYTSLLGQRSAATSAAGGGVMPSVLSTHAKMVTVLPKPGSSARMPPRGASARRSHQRIHSSEASW
eukprot:6197673-Pleurochrysis_carterae.AAC.1